MRSHHLLDNCLVDNPVHTPAGTYTHHELGVVVHHMALHLVMVSTQDLWDMVRILVPWEGGQNPLKQEHCFPHTVWERLLHHHLWLGNSLPGTEFGDQIQCNVVRSLQSVRRWEEKFMLHGMSCPRFLKYPGKGRFFFFLILHAYFPTCRYLYSGSTLDHNIFYDYYY
jgi:hypothetical protein